MHADHHDLPQVSTSAGRSSTTSHLQLSYLSVGMQYFLHCSDFRCAPMALGKSSSSVHRSSGTSCVLSRMRPGGDHVENREVWASEDASWSREQKGCMHGKMINHMASPPCAPLGIGESCKSPSSQLWSSGRHRSFRRWVSYVDQCHGWNDAWLPSAW